MRRWIVNSMILLALLAANLGAAETNSISLSGAVYIGSEPDLGLTDLWLATLSKQPTLKVLDRANMRAILGELSLAGVNDDSARQVRLGRLLGIEYFASIRASDDQALMEVVEAATGRGIAVVPIRFAKGQFADNLPKLAEQAVQALSRPLPARSQLAPSIAFSIPRFSVSNAAVQVATEKIIVDLSGLLAESGITVLSRRFAADAVQERWRQEKGLVEDVATNREFLGADYILGIAVEATNSIEFVMVETATGRRIGKKEMPLEEARTDEGLKALNEWEMARLTPVIARPSVPCLQSAGNTNAHYGAPEILKSVYAGMVLHNQGRYFDALSKFREALSRQNHLDENLNWIASCYRLAGFPEIGDGLIYYVDHVSTYNVMLFGQSYDLKRQRLERGLPYQGKTLNEQSDPGIVLLGVTADVAFPRGLAERMGMLLIDRLHEASGTTVLASEDIAALRDEYDLLLGLDKVKGTTWQQAPPILAQNAVTAHLEPEKTGIRLRLCLIRNCNPTSIYDAVTTLPSESSQWIAVIDKAVRALLARKDSAATPWTPSPVIVEEKQTQLLEQLDKSVDLEVYLKALTRDPNLTKYRSKAPWRSELNRWFLRSLPAEHKDRPRIEFEVASSRVYGRVSREVVKASRSEFQKLAKEYPNDDFGLFSRYNLALIDMRMTNLPATQEEIGAVATGLTPFNMGKYNFIESMSNMDAALRYIIGLPGGKPKDAFLYGGFISIQQFDNGRTQEEYFRAVSGFLSPFKGEFFIPKTKEQARVDLEAFCHYQEYGIVSPWFLQRFVDENGVNSEITQYAVLKYLYPMNCTVRESKVCSEAEVCAIYKVIPELYKLVKTRETNAISVNTRYDHNFERFPAIRNEFNKMMQKILGTLQTENKLPKKETYEKYDKAWQDGPLKNSICFDYPHYCVKGGVEYYIRYLGRLHELYDNEVKSHAICRAYFQFGIAFFRCRRYDLAEPLFEQIISFRDYKSRPPETKTHAMSLHLLAMIKQINGNPTEALRLAKEAVDFMDAHPETSLIGNSGAYDDGNWKADAIALMKHIRETPGTPIKNPYHFY